MGGGTFQTVIIQPSSWKEEKKTKMQFVTIFILGFILFVQNDFAQNPTQQSYEKAREFFNSSIEA